MRLARKMLLSDWYVLDGAEDVPRMVETLKRVPGIVTAEPDYILEVVAEPNDPYWDQQWGARIITDTSLSTTIVNPGAAWDYTTGSSLVRIAILDTGLDKTHPDIDASRVVAEWDFVNNDGDASDDNGHGTSVTGIALATGNNGTGIAGMHWANTKILVTKVCNASGGCSSVCQSVLHDEFSQLPGNRGLGLDDIPEGLFESPKRWRPVGKIPVL